MERFTNSLDDSFAHEFDELIAARGVRHGQLNLISLAAEHHHAHDGQGEEHVHYRPAR